MTETNKLLDRVEVCEHDGVHTTYIIIDGIVKINHIELPRLLTVLNNIVYGK
jgi:hypothetical protein